MKNQIIDSSQFIDLYALPNITSIRKIYFTQNKSAKIQKIQNNSYLTKKLFHAVQHGYLNYLETVPKNFLKSCLNVTDERNGLSLLHYAVLENHVDILTFLLKLKPDINIIASKKVRPIHLASQKGHVEIIELLCKQKSLYIDAGDDKGQTALHIACRRGHKEVLKVLLRNGASVHKLESDKISVMHHPIRRNDLDMINILFYYNAPLNVKNNNGQTPIMIAAIEGYVELFNILLLKFKENNINVKNALDEKDNDGLCCLSYAVQNKNIDIIKICLDFHVDIDTKQADGKTIFHTASVINYPIVFELMRSRDININVADNHLNSPLHHAIINNVLDMVKVLLIFGANINLCNKDFQTPILLACAEITASKNLSEIIKLLIIEKADLNIRDYDLKTIFHYLVEKENIDLIKWIFENISESQSIELVNSQDIADRSPLHYAVSIGNLEICKVLLVAGANPNIFAENDSLPLHIAAAKGHLDIVKLLLDSSRKSESYRDINESSAIHIAAENGNYEIFKFLIETGKDCLAKDEFGRNTLMFAARSGCLPIVEYLLSNEMNVNLHDQMKVTALHQAATEGHLQVVQCLWASGAIFSDNMFGQSPLDIAILNNQQNVLKFFLNDDNWKHVMAYRHENGSSHIENLIKSDEDLTLELLDKCITENTSNKMDPNYEVHYLFSLIDAGPDDSASISERYHALKSMTEFNRLKLLRHPLSAKLLKIKWNQFGMGFFTVDFILFLVYIVLITYYILYNEHILDSDLVDEVTGCKKNTSSSKDSEKKSTSVPFLVSNLMVIVIVVIRTIISVGTVIFKKFRNIFELRTDLFFTCNTLAILFIKNPSKLPCLAEWQIVPGLIFLSYFLFIYYLRHFPLIGIQIIMFQKVLNTMARVLVSFSTLFLGFAFGFYIINQDQDPFKHLGLAYMKSIAMMTGEFDLVTYFLSGKKNYYVTSLIMISIFVVIMSIALFNLIIGLAVGDIGNIASEATMEAYKLKVGYIMEVETRVPAVIQRYLYHSKICERIKSSKRKSFIN